MGGHFRGTCGVLGLHSMMKAGLSGYAEGVDLQQNDRLDYLEMNRDVSNYSS